MSERSVEVDAPAAEPRRRRRWPIAVAVVAALVVLGVALAGRVLVATDEPRRADAVVVLSGDVLGQRLREGAEVFRSTGSDRLIVFVEGSSSVYDARAAATEYLRGEGVDAERVRLLPPGGSTAEEARAIAGMAARCGWRTVTVVTSPYHTLRAALLVRRAVGPAVDVAVVASPDESFHPGTWWADEVSTEDVLLEWTKLVSSVRYVFGGLGPVDPGAAC